jgi:hypothetical protein
MADIMTKAEIETNFVDEWILVENPEIDETNEVLRGHVICHSKNRDVIDRELLARRPKHFAILCTGTIPPNMAIVL